VAYRTGEPRLAEIANPIIIPRTMALSIIPHELFEADCCGCLMKIIGNRTEYRCNE